MTDTNYEIEHIRILKKITWIVVPILSFLFLFLPNKWINIVMIILMLVFNFILLPCNYIEDPEMNF